MLHQSSYMPGTDTTMSMVACTRVPALELYIYAPCVRPDVQDWSGKAGEVCYPPFINAKAAAWPVHDPVGKGILQEHDQVLLGRSLELAVAVQRARWQRA